MTPWERIILALIACFTSCYWITQVVGCTDPMTAYKNGATDAKMQFLKEKEKEQPK